MQEIRSSNPPVVTGICDPIKSRAGYHRSFKLGSKLKHLTLISCLKRFAGRRGKINLFISDNFQTFVSDELKNFLSSNNISWKYILPLSPWWGGFYKLFIRIVKSTL